MKCPTQFGMGVVSAACRADPHCDTLPGGHGNLKLTVTNLSVDVNGSSLEVQSGVLGGAAKGFLNATCGIGPHPQHFPAAGLISIIDLSPLWPQACQAASLANAAMMHCVRVACKLSANAHGCNLANAPIMGCVKVAPETILRA
eukprot:1159832-Pelagomonas_calceolata.AAC.3